MVFLISYKAFIYSGGQKYPITHRKVQIFSSFFKVRDLIIAYHKFNDLPTLETLWMFVLKKRQ